MPKKIKKQYKVDDTVYVSKGLYDFHIECKKAKEAGHINSFEVPHALSKKSRYTTYKPVIDDIQFDSMMEARYYIKLCEDKSKNRIKGFELQVPYELQPKFKKNGKAYRGIEYVCDFLIHCTNNKCIVVDIKGKETVEFKIKHKLFEYKYPDLELKVIQYYEPTNEWLELAQIRKIVRNNKKK